MANPRKFSEKIALHNQKQAEETAAFEAIMREVSGATRPPIYQKHHLHISQNLGAYRGGSLPNVNQITSSNTIDLQNALNSLEDMKHGRQTLATDRLHRDRVRQLPHRSRPLQFEKRTDCSPYGSAYLSPPPDTSWRRFPYLEGTLSRTNSDSALHTSAMGGDHYMTPITPPTQRRGVDVDNSIQPDNMHLKAYWDPKKFQLQSRPKSCEVPNINIYPSQDPDSGLPHIPISNNTGSLPDLTTLHFPSPMVTPIDGEDHQPPAYHGSMSLTTTQPHLGVNQQSPVSRRRHPHGGPSPLVLNDSNHMQLPLSPPVAPAKLALDARLRHQYSSYAQQRYLRQQQQQQQLQQRNGVSAVGVSGGTAAPKPSPTHPRSLLGQVLEQSGEMGEDAELRFTLAELSDEQIAALQVAANSLTQQMADDITDLPQLSPPTSSPQQSPTRLVDHSPTQLPHQSPGHRSLSNGSEPTMTQYRSSTSDNTCQSPTSPLSQPSHSPSQSPSLPNNVANNSLFTDTFYLQQQQQANSLQHQFEQFSMLHDNQLITSPTTTSPNDFMFSCDHNASVNLAQAALQSQMNEYGKNNLGMTTLDQIQMSALLMNPHMSQLHHLSSSLPNNKIPDIIFTGVDDSLCRQDLSKELGNAITGFTDSLDSDFFPSDDALKVGLDPLDLDGLQMLTDPSLITDPANEDSFRLDRL